MEEYRVAELKGHLYARDDAQISSYIISHPDTPQEKMNALFVALFKGSRRGFAEKVLEKEACLYRATANLYDYGGKKMLLLRALEFFCKKADPEALKDVPEILRQFIDGRILYLEYVKDWYRLGSTEPASSSNPIWNACKSFMKLYEYEPLPEEYDYVPEAKAEEAKARAMWDAEWDKSESEDE
ncbi:hypothetical protein QQ045_020407 [Rhodiola kirilowii]